MTDEELKKLYGELKDRHGAETTSLMLLYN